MLLADPIGQKARFLEVAALQQETIAETEISRSKLPLMSAADKGSAVGNEYSPMGMIRQEGPPERIGVSDGR